MEELSDLATLVRQKGKRSIQLVNQNFRKNEKSKDNLLYDLIVNDKINCEETAAKRLFNTDPVNRNFRNTKLKLRQKLLNNLFFLDYDERKNSLYTKVKYESILRLSQYKILIMEGRTSMVLKKLPVLVKTALEFEMIEIALEGLIILRNEYSKIGRYSPQLDAEKQMNALRPLHKAIIDSEALYYDTLVIINKSKNSCLKIKDIIPERIKIIQQNATKFKSRRMDILSKMLSIQYYRMCNKSEHVVQVCNELEKKYFPQAMNRIKVNINVAYISGSKLDALYKLNETEQYKIFLNQKINLFQPGSPEWMLFMEYWFLMSMKAGNYPEASNIYKNVRSKVDLRDGDPSLTDRWRIYRAYLCFIAPCREIQRGFNFDKLRQLNGNSNRQNYGYNIASLIIRFLYSLQEGEISTVKKCIGELSKYSSYHLDKRHNYRNSIFIRILEIIIDNNFDYEAISEKIKFYLRKLNQDSNGIADFSDELEVIPYEKLWNIISGILKTNKHYKHYRFYHYSEG